MATKVVAILLLIVVLVVAGTFVITLAWQWVVPDVFSGMVKAELLPATITFWQALKLAILLTVLGVAGSRGSSKS